MSATGWGELANVCATLARQEDLQCNERLGILVREALLEASNKPWPTFDKTMDEQFETAPSCGMPNARISAAEGLACLACNEACATDEVLGAVRRLVADEVAAVRFQVVRRLFGMYANRRDMVWDLATERASKEKNLGVLRTLLVATLDPRASGFRVGRSELRV